MGEVLSRPAEVKKDAAWVDLLKIVLTVGIVLRHATMDPASHGIVLLTEVCVPLFYALSGYLFFYRTPERPDAGFFLGKWKKRIFSLLIPYLIANVFAFGFYYLAGRYAPSLVSGYFGDRLKDPLFVLWTGPVNLSLWFIRDLMIAVVTAPLIWLLVRYGRFWAVLAVGLLWLFGVQTPWNNFFFILGAGLAILKEDVEADSVKTAPYLLLLYLGALILAWKEGGRATSLSVLAALPLCVWGASKAVRALHGGIDPKWRAWCFFVYLYHYLPLIGIKKFLSQAIAPQSGFAWVMVYLASAAAVLALLTGVYLLLRRFLPRVTQWVVGGK